MAMPATCSLIGTPASIKESEAPHTVAIEEEPFEEGGDPLLEERLLLAEFTHQSGVFLPSRLEFLGKPFGDDPYGQFEPFLEHPCCIKYE